MNNSLIKKSPFIVIALSLAVIVSCKNPFATREPEPPTEGRSSWQYPESPEIVLQNMAVAIKEKNVENYLKCLVDSSKLFQFTPDQYEAANNPGIFEQWTLAHEQSYINKAFSSIPDDSIRSLSFVNNPPTPFLDSWLIQASYTLRLHHTLDKSYPKQVKGNVDLWFILRNGYWVINKWIDYTIIDTTANRIPSWSTIKASFIK